MVSKLLPTTGTPMSATYIGAHIGLTGAYGAGAIASFIGLWVLTNEQRKNAAANSTMEHDKHAIAPLWIAFVFAFILMGITFIWYMFDGTIATLLGHEPPAFGDSFDNPQYWYEGLYFVMTAAVTIVPTGVQSFRHCITVGPTAGLVAVSTVLNFVIVIARFQVKSTAFFWVVYVFICLWFLAINVIITLLSNLSMKGVYARMGALMFTVLVFFYGYVALDMVFGFWFANWIPYNAIVVQIVWSTVGGYAVVVVAIASQSKNIAELEAKLQRSINNGVEAVQGVVSYPIGGKAGNGL